LLGSIRIAVPLLLLIALVLAWGTLYETRFGTSAVQRFVYHSWWFQGLLAFLALNLALAALARYPWKRQHLPFVLAHIGIILILFGGILGGRFGVDGQLIIQEGEASKTLQLSTNVLVVHQPNPGIHQVIPTRFETQAWLHEPNRMIPVVIDNRTITLTVDRYYPDAVVNEEITGGGTEDNPAIRLLVSHREQQDELWLLARDPERMGAGWGEAHLLFLEPATDRQFKELLRPSGAAEPSRGVVTVRMKGMAAPVELPVPDVLSRSVELTGTPYRVTFKDYFPDFALTEHGPSNRSQEPNNPAVSLTLEGPEGVDAYLLFALHPEISAMHGWRHTIQADVAYTHPSGRALPPNAVAVLLGPSGTLSAVLTGSGAERQAIEPVDIGARYTHPWIGYEFEVAAFHPRASIAQHVENRSDEVRAEAIHLIGEEDGRRAEAWVGLRGQSELALGREAITVEYRPAQRELPFAIKLLDFRKTDYPGTQMAASFECDVQLSDPQRGLILMRKISMNNPLRYRGYSLYQSSFIPGEVETTVLSVRNDPGTPFVYAGFLIVIAGVVFMFVLRSRAFEPKRRSAS
jgi:cytochrome c biogenesis protein ResB